MVTTIAYGNMERKRLEQVDGILDIKNLGDTLDV